MASLGEFQTEVLRLWAASPLKVDSTAVAAVAKMAEEVGEVAAEVIKGGSGDALALEIGDVLFVLARIANHTGVSLEDAAYGALSRFAARYVTAPIKGPPILPEPAAGAERPACAIGVADCCFMTDEAVRPGSVCFACGAVKAPEGAGDAWEPPGLARPAGCTAGICVYPCCEDARRPPAGCRPQTASGIQVEVTWGKAVTQVESLIRRHQGKQKQGD